MLGGLIKEMIANDPVIQRAKKEAMFFGPIVSVLFLYGTYRLVRCTVSEISAITAFVCSSLRDLKLLISCK